VEDVVNERSSKLGKKDIRGIALFITVISVGNESDTIESVIQKASTTKGMISTERKYDIVFTNNGIAFLLVEGAVKTGIGGFGAADVFINKALSDKKIQDKRAAYGGLTLPEMLSKSDKNAYYLYSDVKSVNVKKSMMGCTMNLEVGDEKYKCTFSGNQMDTANQAVSKHLAAKAQ